MRQRDKQQLKQYCMEFDKNARWNYTTLFTYIPEIALTIHTFIRMHRYGRCHIPKDALPKLSNICMFICI